MQEDNKREIKFGTDGWRGVISDDFTFANVRRVAKAIADYYNRVSTEPRIVVGYDTRFLSANYAQAVSDVLSDNGIDVLISDRPIPTPALSFSVPRRKLTAGLMITASHNPQEYNGIKIKTQEGGAAAMDITKQVEQLIVSPSNAAVLRKGKVQKVNLIDEYCTFLRSYIDFKKLRATRFKVLVDPMYGSGNSFIADILKGTRIRLEFIRCEINPSFGGLRPEPIIENLQDTIQKLKHKKFDVCLVLDGDADRIAAFAGNAEFINPQKILGLLMLHLVQDRKMTGAVVKTLVGTNLIDKIAAALGLKVFETPVGFKYISELMIKEDVLLGGEEAGGMGFKGYIPERDGTLAGLLLLEMMAYRNKPILKILCDMEKQFGRYYYERDAIRIEGAGLAIDKLKTVQDILGKKVVKINDSDGIKFFLENEDWLMVRPSGTEPIVRVYAESKSQANTRKLLQFGIKLVKDALRLT